MTSREQFEAWFPSMVNGMPEDMRHVFDEMLFMAWQASRAAVDIELPATEIGYEMMEYYDPQRVVEAIESAGLKVKV